MMQQPQPSWATQWIRLISRPFNPSIPLGVQFDIHSHTTLNDDNKAIFYELLLEFFSILLDGEKSSMDEAILLLSRRRKKMGFEWTLTYGNNEALAYAKVDKRAVASLDYQVMLEEHGRMSEMDSSIQSIGRDNIFSSSRISSSSRHDPPTTAKFINLPRPAEQHEKFTTDIKRFPRPIWEPPKPLPEPQKDLTFSGGPINFKAEFSDMFESIGRPEPGLSGKLHVWSRTRAELCETTPYFRAYQGGVHVDRLSNLMGYLLYVNSAPSRATRSNALASRDGCPAP
jgi:hypothetical protein